MRIKRLHFKNFGIHEELYKEVGSSILGLIGPNGSGKSTIEDGIKFLLTGLMEEKQETYVRDFDAYEGAPTNADLTMWFSHDDKEGKIYRRIGKSPKRLLEWDGEKITASRKIEERLSEILNADKQALNNAIFIKQGELDKIFFGTPGERQDTFTRMLLMKYVEKRAQLVDKKIHQLNHGLEDFTLMKDTTDQSVTDAEREVIDLKAHLRDKRDWTPEIRLWDSVKTKATAASVSKQTVRDANALLRSLEEASRRLVSDVSTTFPGGADEISNKLDQVRDTRVSVVEFLSRLDAIREVAKRRQDLSLRVDNLQKNKREVDAWLNKTAEQENLSVDTTSLENWSGVLQQLKDKTVCLSEDLRNQANRRSLKSQIENLQTTLAEDSITQEKASEDLKAEHVKSIETAELMSELNELREERTTLRVKKDLLTAASRIQGSSCPVCGSVLQEVGGIGNPEDVAARIKEISSRIDTITTNQDAADKRRNVLEHTVSSLSAKMAENGKSLVEKMMQVSSMSALAFPDLSEEELQAEHTRLLLIASELDRAVQTSKNLELDLGPLQAELGAIPPEAMETQISEDQEKEKREELAKMDAEIAKMTAAVKTLKERVEIESRQKANIAAAQDAADRAMDEEEEAIQAVEGSERLAEVFSSVSETGTIRDSITDLSVRAKVMEALEEIQLEFSSLRGKISQASSTLDRAREAQEALHRRMESDQQRRDVIAGLRQLHGALSKNGVVEMYIQHRFEQLVPLTQYQLGILNADFEVKSDPDRSCSFLFRREDGSTEYWMPQSKLSGGQKVRLTIAFLQAVQQLIIPEVGLLVLDEPSVHLDQEGIESLRELLQTWGHTYDSSDAQIVVCDHDPLLESALGDCIVLKAKEAK